MVLMIEIVSDQNFEGVIDRVVVKQNATEEPHLSIDTVRRDTSQEIVRHRCHHPVC